MLALHPEALTHSMSIRARSRRWHVAMATGLQAGDPVALMELYDATSATVYAYALQIAITHDDACQATLKAYLTAWRTPQLFSDARVPAEVRLASLIRSTPARDGCSPGQVTKTQSRKLP